MQGSPQRLKAEMSTHLKRQRKRLNRGYLATEGLYAEIMSSKNGIAERLQTEGIMVAGPSTITALLNSLAMGFRSIAINEKANEVWKVLGAAKTQYEKFGDLLQKATSIDVGFCLTVIIAEEIRRHCIGDYINKLLLKNCYNNYI